ncbi:beta-N-acetylhexosaminidase [Rhodoblastus acidophilus]|uniref:beta-N-acetylhexosaminidase n=1 Tax=Candidatus Rhodoblastus alkanivorans TaxID=2954117 RepID=A0ABS9ZCF2_9HYPH|nr:beta-N-acetylhexosaminidase [Candidatus Rhodoblastus alkanivorans]MCI4679996.1 beta-N-acetylhexosaminidase [Candidatus Rhodoblastus alkanivorans]MCI4684262.1 beta-N-acetylhexosaminidase [Candidatus Rhodoblastus alkanivorans]MDI4641582.1 beta-N-acetylhexosaminidase [Rhodoblastus acidophilus]
MGVRAFIAGCAGLALSPDERAFFTEARPWGLILFRRNVESPDQVRALTDSFRDLLGADAAVLVDQEGGRVQRLGPPHWPAYPPAAAFGRMGADGARLAQLGARLIAYDLRAVGIDFDCLPVLDSPAPCAHEVIGDRAYADNPRDVARLGRAAALGLMAGGIAPVMKHIPGHGRARADSHVELPRVKSSRAELEVDFAPFKANADLPAAMTAHVVYEALDPLFPATHSRAIVENVVRGEIGFDGLLMTDDLSMKALEGRFFERAARAFGAGVDLALHCNGDLAEAGAVAQASPLLGGRALERVERARAAVAAAESTAAAFDPVEARAELFAALAALA